MSAKTAVITGASGNLGQAIVKNLLKKITMSLVPSTIKRIEKTTKKKMWKK